MSKIFVSGIGTAVGKTISSAILCRALDYPYWKAVQSGPSSDTQIVQTLVQEAYLQEPAFSFKEALSPHIADFTTQARATVSEILERAPKKEKLIIEGAGGLMVPLNRKESTLDLIVELKASVLLVSKHYLGSINHTLLSLELLRRNSIPLLGVLFIGNDDFGAESLIEARFPDSRLNTIPLAKEINSHFIHEQARKIKNEIQKKLHQLAPLPQRGTSAKVAHNCLCPGDSPH